MIAFGTNNISKMLFGNLTVEKMFLGNLEIYSASGGYDYSVDNGVITLNDAPYSVDSGVITIL